MLELKRIHKKFANTEVLRDFSVSVGPGEFISLLGPSGCGKTTALRIIAGLEDPDQGDIFFEGKEITHQPASSRPFNLVFQKYALFPHLSVFENVAFGPRINGFKKNEVNIMALEFLSLVKMENFSHRSIYSLSGGQQQRVALARALVNKPKILLLDEPLSALDKNLRQEMQNELKQIQNRLKTTFIFVTHDQEEAINMSDRVILMDKGQIIQQGSPQDLYNSPNSEFSASFFGHNNCFKGELILQGASLKLKISDDLSVSFKTPNSQKDLKAGAAAKIFVRPENIELFKKAPSEKSPLIATSVKRKIHNGAHVQYLLQPQNKNLETIIATLPNSDVFKCEHFENSETAYVYWDPKSASLQSEF